MLGFALALLFGSLASVPGIAQSQNGQNDTYYNITLTDMSPMIQYTPPVVAGSSAWSSLPPPACYQSSSCHTTSTQGSQVGILFQGTAAWFMVSGPATIAITLHNVPWVTMSVPSETSDGLVPAGLSGLP